MRVGGRRLLVVVQAESEIRLVDGGVLCGGGGGGLLSGVVQRHELHRAQVMRRRRRVVPVGQQRALVHVPLCFDNEN